MTSASRIGAGLLGLGLAVPTLAILGSAPASAADPVDIQVLATNDFHGRIKQSGSEAGAAVLAGAVKQLREENPNTFFAAAGDLIGASTFESFIANDKPTIDALNEAGLDVSAVGNHELDQGYDDLVDRVMAPYDETTNPEGGAEWEYIAANLTLKATGDPAVPATWMEEMGGVTVGFVGAVTEDLPSLVSPDGIADLQVDGIVDSVNTHAAELTADGADVVVMLVHEGSPNTDCATMDDAGTTWGDIVTGVGDDVDAIVSGHTHLAYDCEVGGRPVVSAGQYGMNLNQLNFSVDPDTGEILDVEQALLPLMGPDPDGSGPLVPPALYPVDGATKTIVDAAVAEADVLGAEPLGELADGFNRARKPDATENRGGESTVGNLVAEVQRWATDTPETGNAQIAFMNPGGLRADMLGGIEGETDYPKTLTYKQAALVQPFANTLVNMDLTGAQIRTVLEQQWQRDDEGEVPSRPFLRLGVSDGFTYTYDEEPVTVAGTDTFEGTITGMWLDGEPIKADQTYSVTVNSFLASGGDNFFELANGTGKADTGKADLQAMVDYMAAFAPAGSPLEPDFAQRAVGVSFADGNSFARGDTVELELSSLSMTGPGDPQDSEVALALDGTAVDTVPVDSSTVSELYDATGTAEVSFALPAGIAAGAHTMTVTGEQTGTSVDIPIRVVKNDATIRSIQVTPKKIVAKKTKARMVVRVRSAGDAAKGKVQVKVGGKTYTQQLRDGVARFTLKKFKKPGKVTARVTYLGNAATKAARDTVTFRVVRKK
ncbi:bifunctional metallophosphatase/5'-nucleotidase [Nocardioides sp. BGMRC 2183]|nr:bifunctional metallophosphatase/5'-nucleotidase [Nocardioides sp. BGMRC 2183]